MSLKLQLIQAITVSERQIDGEASKLRSYLSQIENLQQQTNAAFGGTSVPAEQAMVQSLADAKEQVTQTLQNLEAAKTKLQQIETV